MATLRRARMEELCELVTDGTHDSPKLQKDGVPFIKGKNISGGTVDFSTCDFITQQDHEEACKRVKPRRGDILFSNIGSVGDTALVKDDREFSIKNVALFRPNSHKVEGSYFYYVVLSPEFRSNVINVRSGAAQPFISLANLRAFEVSYIEDFNTQRRVSGILSAYDELIENSQRRIRILETMARSLYQEWFVNFRFPEHEKHPRVTSP
ncbi:MAG: restriction endonuclease subunit S, partial [Chthoniobacterales bacterium]|nr:restriction endonuclease subunit S [Chthoniobacterales bacterium]